VGPITAAQVLVSWSHAGRWRSEAAFAALAETSPIPASSGRVTRYRLNRRGDRQLNNALHTIAVVRLRDDPLTRAYAQRRATQGKNPARSSGASSTSSPASSTSSWNATTNPQWRSPTPLDRHSSLGVFPNDAALLRLAGMLLLEQNDEWLVGRRYLSETSMVLVVATDHPNRPPRPAARRCPSSPLPERASHADDHQLPHPPVPARPGGAAPGRRLAAPVPAAAWEAPMRRTGVRPGPPATRWRPPSAPAWWPSARSAPGTPRWPSPGRRRPRRSARRAARERSRRRPARRPRGCAGCRSAGSGPAASG
jgi:hypothetical protein